VLLARYLDEQYGEASPADQLAFRELLEVPDPLIYAWCLGRAPPPTAALSSLIGRIAALESDRGPG